MNKTAQAAVCSLIVLLCTIPAFSQQVKITGKVSDAQTSSPLVGASVILQETKKGVTTDVEGRFFLQLEKGHKYTIRVVSVGYAAKTLTDVTADNTNSLDVTLDEDKKNQLELVVVKSTSAKRESIASIYLTQKNSSAISDGISADMIKKSPDKNTGEVLKRVSGASVQDNKFVVIRGLNERYNASLLNNSILPSTEPDKKAFSFDIIPSSLVDNVVIYKSATPDLPGDFAGGAVKITTKDYPVRKLSELSISVGYNTLTTFKEFYRGYPKGSLDGIGFFDNSRLIPNPYYTQKSNFSNLPEANKSAITKQFPNTYGYEKVSNNLPNISVSYTGGNTKLLNNGKKLGYIYALSYGTSRKVSERERTEYQSYNLSDYDYTTNNYDIRNNLSAMLNLSYSFGKSKIAWKNMFNNDFSNITGLRSGIVTANSSPIYIKGTGNEATGNGIVNSVVEGLHKLNSTWTLDWNGSFGYTYRWQPDQKVLTYRSDDSPTSNFYLKLNNENSPEIRNAGRVYSFLTEYIYGANINIAKQFNWLGQQQKLKIGGTTYYRTRNLEVDALGYSALNSVPGGVRIDETKATDFNNIFSNENIDKYRLTVANIATNSTDYKGTGFLNAGYVMLDNKFAQNVKLTWGARVENYNQKLETKGAPTVNLQNFDVLPSLLLTYGLNDKTNLRLAGFQSVNRPEFRELATYSVYDYDNNVVIRGNSALERARITNGDLRYEWFPGAGEIVSVSAFYKYFKSPIEQVYLGNDVYSYQNAESADAYGAEVELRKKLDFIGGDVFNHFTFYANAAYIKGSVKLKDQNNNIINTNSPLQGQSPYLVNAGLTYTSIAEDFSVNVLYNRIGTRLRSRGSLLSGGARDVFEAPRDVIDLQVTKRFMNDKFEIKATVSDILAQSYRWFYKFDTDHSQISYDASKDRVVNSIKYGPTINLSLRYSFSK